MSEEHHHQEHHHKVTGTVKADGSWTGQDVVYETHHHGSIHFKPEKKAGSRFYMRLCNDGEIFGDEVHWDADDYDRKRLARDVHAKTPFTIDAKGTNEETEFSGELSTE